MKIIHTTVLVIFVTILASSCCRDKRPDIPDKQCEVRPDEHYFRWLGEAKEYMYFKAGTWWVYKNTSSGLTDTIFVYQSRLDTSVTRGTTANFYYKTMTSENAIVSTYSMLYNKYYSWSSREAGLGEDLKSGYSVWVHTRSGGYVSQTFAFPLDLHLRTDADLISKDTSIQVGPVHYDSVQVFQVNLASGYYDILESSWHTTQTAYLYYAKGVGLIRQQNVKPVNTIELVACNIIQ